MKKIATCTICEAGCGILVDVTTKNGREAVSSVRGDPDDPISRGYICPKAVAMQDLHEDPDRLRRPLMRGKDGEHREASWEEALSFAGAQIRRVRREHGPSALAVYQGNPTVHNLGLLTVGQFAFRTLGTRNLYSASTADQVPHMRAAHEMFGHVILMPVPDVDRTDFWLVVGANPVVSNGSIMTAPDIKRRIKELKARGGRLVVVDPRRTETAKLADQHVFLRPGSDALFFFSLLHVIFAEGLANPRRLTPMLAGLGELTSLATRFTPERVAPHTGVDPTVLRALARSFAGARRAAAYARVGTCHQEHGTVASWLAYSLAAVTGNLDHEGGTMWTTPAANIAKIAELAGLSGGDKFTSRVRGLPETGGELPIATLADEIETPGEGRVRALITSAGNPVLSAPNGRHLERALDQLDVMVSIDNYLNETTRHAHVILPPCSSLQRAHYDLALNAFSVENSAKWVDPPLARGPEELDDATIVRELIGRVRFGDGKARSVMMTALGGALDPERIVDLALRSGPYGAFRGGLSVAKLRRDHPHGVRLGALTPRLPSVLRTPSKRVELAPPAFVREVTHLEASMKRLVSPLALIGRRQLRGNNSWLHNSERLIKGPPRCTLLMNPADATRLKLKAGDLVRVTSAAGFVEAPMEITDEMMPGVVSLPHGFGHDGNKTRTRVASAHAGVSVNDVTDDTRVDRLTGNAAFSAVPVDVTLARSHSST